MRSGPAGWRPDGARRPRRTVRGSTGLRAAPWGAAVARVRRCVSWKAKVKASKFNDWPGYGKATEGVIGLQDHRDRAAYRNIKIRPIR